MEYVALGKSNLLVSRTAYGAMSLDCREIEAFGDQADEVACRLVHQAYEGGMNFFDTSHSKENCEKRLGLSLHGIRQNVKLATKTTASDVHTLRNDLRESLDNLQTDYIDLYQLENPLALPLPGTPDGIYSELVAMKEKGLILHIGVVSENYDIIRQAIESECYETVQFTFNMLTESEALELVNLCAEKDVGCIAMQPLCGGLVENIPLAFGFLYQYENAVPVWGVHTQEELQQILYFNDHPPVVDEQFLSEVAHFRKFYN